MKLMWQRLKFLATLLENQKEDNLEKFTLDSGLSKSREGHNKGEGEVVTSGISNIRGEFEDILDCETESHSGTRIRPEYYPEVKKLFEKLVLNPDEIMENMNESLIWKNFFNEMIDVFAERLRQEPERYQIIIPNQLSVSDDNSWIKLPLIFAVISEYQQTQEKTKVGLKLVEILRKIAQRIDPNEAKTLVSITDTRLRVLKGVLKSFFDEFGETPRKEKRRHPKVILFKEVRAAVRIVGDYWEHRETIQQLLNYLQINNLAFDFSVLFTQCVLWKKKSLDHEEKNLSQLEPTAETEWELAAPMSPNSVLFNFSPPPFMTEGVSVNQESTNQSDFFDTSGFLNVLQNYSIREANMDEFVAPYKPSKAEDHIIWTNAIQNVREFFNAVNGKDIEYALKLAKSGAFDPNLTREQVSNHYDQYDEKIKKDTALFAILQIPKSPFTEEILSYLIELDGTNINQINSEDYSLLEILIKTEYYEHAKKLIERGADIARPENTTALHAAAARGNDEIIQLLLDKGADVNAADQDGDTPLHMAVYNRHVHTVKLLLEKGAEPELENHNECTPITYAEKDPEPLEILILFRTWQSDHGKGEEVDESEEDGDGFGFS